jgi:hypothetical protein
MVLAIFALSLFAAACGGGSADSSDDIASLEDAGAGADEDSALAAPTPEQPEEEELTFEEAQLEFSACMRQTYPSWPDPDPDAGSGRRLGFNPQALQDLGISFQDEGFQAALGLCQESFQGVAGTGDGRTAEEQAELEDNLLELFACVRETPGYEGIPDPDFGASGGQGFGLRDLFQSGDFDPQEFRSLMSACSEGLGIDGLGGGPGARPGGGRPGQGAPQGQGA